MYEVKKCISSGSEESIGCLQFPLQFPEFMKTFIAPDIKGI